MTKLVQTSFLWSFCILLSLFMSRFVFSYHIVGNTLYDLQSNDQESFNIEAGTWNASDLVDGVTKTYKCNGIWLLGGYNILVQNSNPPPPFLPAPSRLLKTPQDDSIENISSNDRILQSGGAYFETYYTDLPAHDFIKARFKAFPLDKWKGDSFEVIFDGDVIEGFSIYSQQYAVANICGNMDFEDLTPIDIEIKVPHNQSTLSLQIASLVGDTSNDISLGFRDLVIEFTFFDDDCPTTELCGRADFPLPQYCPCEENEYMEPYQTGTCFACDPSCGSCLGPGNASCTSCPLQYYLEEAEGPCRCLPCQEGCSECYSHDDCSKCLNGYFRVYEGESLQCYPTCNPPLIRYKQELELRRILQDDMYCESLCYDESEYLFLDESCSYDCSAPLEHVIWSSFNLCLPRCYPNFLNWEGSCIESCPSPYKNVTIDDVNHCQLPCEDPSHYYMEHLGQCSENCTDPLYGIDSTEPYLRCLLLPPPPPPYNEPEIEVIESGGLLLAPLKPNTLTVVVLVKTMQYVRYLDMRMPPRLERIARSRGRNALSVRSGAEMPESEDANYGKSSLPSIFEHRNLTPSFLVNYFENLTTIWIALFSAVSFILLEKLFKKLEIPFLVAVSERIRSICKWNFFLMVLVTNIDDIVLYASLEFRTSFIKGGSALSVFSFLFALFFMCFAGVFLYGIYYLVKQIIKSQTTIVPAKSSFNANEIINQKWESCQIFYKGFNTKKAINQYFYLIYTLRIVLPMMVVAIAYTVPLFISIVEVLVSISIIVYLIAMNPFQKKINLIQLLMFESIVFIMNFCIMILAGMDANESYNEKAGENLGDVVIIGNDIINIMALVFFVTKIGLESMAVYKTQSKQSLSTLMKTPPYIHLVIALYLQQSHMGFEEMISTSQVSPTKVVSLTENKSVAQFQKNSLDHSQDQTENSTRKFITQEILEDKTSRIDSSKFYISPPKNSYPGVPLENAPESNFMSKNPFRKNLSIDLSFQIANNSNNYSTVYPTKNQFINLHETINNG